MPVTKATRPTRVKSTIDKILSAAMQVIAERGAASLSISEVCRTANIARPTLYRHFSTMEELTDALFKRLCDDFDKEIRAAINANPGIEKRIDVFASYLAGRIAGASSRMIYVTNADFGKQLVNKYLDNRREIFEWVLTPLFDLSETITGRKVDRHLATDVLTRYYISLQEHRAEIPLEEASSNFSQLMHGLLHIRPADIDTRH